MPQEIEAKFRVPTHHPIRERLIALGAKRIGLVVETNEILDRPDGLLRASGCGLRIRQTVDLDDSVKIPAEPNRAIVTFKGKAAHSAFKSREEIEFVASDVEAARSLFAALGFVVHIRYEKRRETWLSHDCKVELDEPARLGLFVEVEGPSDDAIQHAQTLLEIPASSLEPASYVALLAEHCRQSAESPLNLRLSRSS